MYVLIAQQEGVRTSFVNEAGVPGNFTWAEGRKILRPALICLTLRFTTGGASLIAASMYQMTDTLSGAEAISATQQSF